MREVINSPRKKEMPDQVGHDGKEKSGMTESLVTEPVFGVLGGGVLPEFEVEKVFPADGVHNAHNLAGLDLVSGLHGYGCKFGIEGVIRAVVHQHALVVAGQHHNLRDGAVEDSLGLGATLHSQGYAVILREVHVLVHGVLMLSEALHYCAFNRPG